MNYKTMKIKALLKTFKQDLQLRLQEYRSDRKGISFMEVSLLLFLAALLIVCVISIRAIRSGGKLGYAEAAIGLTSLILSCAGFAVPLYGHFIVRSESRLHWLTGVVLNGGLMLFLFFVYGLGIRA